VRFFFSPYAQILNDLMVTKIPLRFPYQEMIVAMKVI